METVCFSETLVSTYKSIQCYKPEDQGWDRTEFTIIFCVQTFDLDFNFHFVYDPTWYPHLLYFNTVHVKTTYGRNPIIKSCNGLKTTDPMNSDKINRNLKKWFIKNLVSCKKYCVSRHIWITHTWWHNFNQQAVA
jgi:hypothetical protein